MSLRTKKKTVTKGTVSESISREGLSVFSGKSKLGLRSWIPIWAYNLYFRITGKGVIIKDVGRSYENLHELYGKGNSIEGESGKGMSYEILDLSTVLKIIHIFLMIVAIICWAGFGVGAVEINYAILLTLLQIAMVLCGRKLLKEANKAVEDKVFQNE